jgi:hypothetical protein
VLGAVIAKRSQRAGQKAGGVGFREAVGFVGWEVPVMSCLTVQWKGR